MTLKDNIKYRFENCCFYKILFQNIKLLKKVKEKGKLKSISLKSNLFNIILNREDSNKNIIGKFEHRIITKKSQVLQVC